MPTALTRTPATTQVICAVNNQTVEIVPAPGTRRVRLRFVGADGVYTFAGTEGTDPGVSAAPANADEWTPVGWDRGASAGSIFVAVTAGAPVTCFVVADG